jgi:hypothetical protein
MQCLWRPAGLRGRRGAERSIADIALSGRKDAERCGAGGNRGNAIGQKDRTIDDCDERAEKEKLTDCRNAAFAQQETE